jgi:hypothetical protein
MSQGIPCNLWVPDCDRKSHIGPGGSDDAKKIHRRRDADPEEGLARLSRPPVVIPTLLNVSQAEQAPLRQLDLPAGWTFLASPTRRPFPPPEIAD